MKNQLINVTLEGITPEAMDYYVAIKEQMQDIAQSLEAEVKTKATLNDKLIADKRAKAARKCLNALRLMHFEFEDAVNSIK